MPGGTMASSEVFEARWKRSGLHSAGRVSVASAQKTCAAGTNCAARRASIGRRRRLQGPVEPDGARGDLAFISSEGKRLFSGVLAANQSKTVEGKESATMKVGNAAGLEVRLNGKLLGPLGGRGQVLVVVFTPDKFQIVPAGAERRRLDQFDYAKVIKPRAVACGRQAECRLWDRPPRATSAPLRSSNSNVRRHCTTRTM